MVRRKQAGLGAAVALLVPFFALALVLYYALWQIAWHFEGRAFNSDVLAWGVLGAGVVRAICEAVGKRAAALLR